MGAPPSRRGRTDVTAPGPFPRLAEPGPADGHYRALFEQGVVGLAIATLDGLVIDVNPAMLRILGSEPFPLPRPMTDFVHPDDLPVVVERFQQIIRAEPDSMRVELRLVRPDAGIVRVHVIASLARDADGLPSHLMFVVEDASQRHGLRPPQHETARDRLARLPGSAMVDRWLQQAYTAGHTTRVGICSLDLDGVQAVNDAFGDEVGDLLLLGVAGRLQLIATENLVTRTDSDEFTVLMTDPAGVAAVSGLADRLQTALAAPFVIGRHTVSVTASIGVAEARTSSSCPGEVLRAAQVARSWAAAMGGGRHIVFDHERDAAEASRFALLRGLRGGIGRGEFRLGYQPLVRLADSRLVGVEALVRWQHPELGLVGPGQFIELAEHSGAIVPLGRWVLETACAQAASWLAELGDDAPYVSVNVSPVQLTQPGWLSEVTAILDHSGLPPEKLQLEITEQAVLGDGPLALTALHALRDAGVRLALDDFGTGYSSLSWLRRLPVHALKIDGSFIEGLRNADADPVDSSIVHALIGMAHALGLEVTAEWVETDRQAERLAALGCDTGQGLWFGDAGPGECVPELLRRNIAT